MDADVWSLVLAELWHFSDECCARATERAARDAFSSKEHFLIRRRTTNMGTSFARAVRVHVLQTKNQLMSLTLHHVPLGGEGALLLAAGDFNSIQILDLTNCGITDVSASRLVWKTKDVPILYLDRNPIDEITFDAVMHKLFHLSSFDNLDVAVSLRNLPEVSTQCVRMLTWGLMQMNGFVKTSNVEVHLSPMDKPHKILLNAARGPLIKLFDGDKPLVRLPFPRFDASGLPVCTHLKIIVPIPRPLVTAPVPLATAPVPLATAPVPLATAPVASPVPLAKATLPKDRNTRRKLPLPHDVKCGACGFVWKQGSITISQCETYRSQCKVHNRLCKQRVGD